MADPSTPVNSLYDQTGIMKLDIRARFNVLKMMHHKVYHVGSPDVISISPESMHRTTVTRSSVAPTLKLPFPKTVKFKSSFMYWSHFLWNSLPVYLRLLEDPLTFKRELKRFVLQYN